MFKPETILIPVDFSSCTQKALGRALDIAEEYNSRICLLHVYKNPFQFTFDLFLPELTHPPDNQEITSAIIEKMKGEYERLILSRNADVEFSIRTGIVYEEILKEISENNVDLTVMAKHSGMHIANLIPGSVTRKVMNKSPVPTLIV
jgi:nucleotide-binding universal stress UspA family protein